jgi:hypothetical protein
MMYLYSILLMWLGSCIPIGWLTWVEFEPRTFKVWMVWLFETVFWPLVVFKWYIKGE